MFSRIGCTKTEKVVDALRETIRSNGFPDGVLPSKLELESHFHVSHRTIDCALKILREEGLIRGVRGIGIFVNKEPHDVSNLTQRLLLLLLHRNIFNEQEPYFSLRSETFKRGYFPINLPLLPGSTLFERASMTQLLRAPIRGVIYAGRSYWREPFLKNYKNIRSVALVHFDGEGSPPGSSVLTDYTCGAYELTRHLIANGARKILVAYTYIAPDVPKSKEYWDRHPSTLVMNGAAKAASEAGIGQPAIHFSSASNQEIGGDVEYFSKFDAIICSADVYAYRIISALKNIGRKVPEDIMVAAVNESVWATGFEHKVTTLNVNPVKLSKVAINLLENGTTEHISLKPDLMIRKSSRS